MKGLSFWQWLGIVIIIGIVGGILFRLAYGKQLIDAAKKNNTDSPPPAIPTDNPYAKFGYYPTTK